MKAMEKFPIKKLSYDLKLELLENMDPRDVIGLVNVNQGFRSIVMGEPWRIFGRHVDSIEIWNNHDRQKIKKLESQISMNGDKLTIELSGSSSHLMKLKTYSTLISKIRSCQHLYWRLSCSDQKPKETEFPAKLLRNLDSVLELVLHIWTFDDAAQAHIEKYLGILSLDHVKKASLDICISQMNQPMMRVLSNFVKTNLNHCKSIDIWAFSSQLSFWYESLSKIWTEMIVLRMRYSYNEMEFESFINRIVTEGIPSSNPEAALLLRDSGCPELANNSIISLFSRTPGISQIAHEARGEVQKIMEQLLLDGLFAESVHFTHFPTDSKRKCIYVTKPGCIFAKYITIG